MEGLAGAVLGGTLTHMRDNEDRRAAERRLVQDAQNGDVVVDPKADRLVRLFGKVKRPAVYELKGPEGILALLGYAGWQGWRAQAWRAPRPVG